MEFDGIELIEGTLLSTVSGPLVLGRRLETIASVTGGAGLNVPHGAAPSSPVNGDIWTTTSGPFIRVNGTTLSIASLNTAQNFTGEVTFSGGWRATGLAAFAGAPGDGGVEVGFFLGEGVIQSVVRPAGTMQPLNINGSNILLTAVGGEIDLTTDTIDLNGNIDADGAVHNLNGTTSVTLVSGSASVAVINSGAEVDITATTIDLNGAVDISSTLSTAGAITISTSGAAGKRQLFLANSVDGADTRQTWIAIEDTDQAEEDERLWLWGVNTKDFRLLTRNAADSSGATPLSIQRGTGTAVSEIELNAVTLDLNGDIDADGTAHDINGSTSVTLTGTANAILALTTSGFNADGSLDLDGTTHNLNGTTSVVLVSSSASISAIASGNEVDLTGTTIDINGNIDADGTTLDLNGSTSLTLTGTANAVIALTTSGVNMDGVLDLDGTGSHNLNGTTSVVLVSSSASISAIASGNEVDLTGTTIDINGNIDADGTTLDLNGTTSVTLTGTANAVIALTTSGFNMDGVLDVDGTGSHNITGTVATVIQSGTATISAIASGNEVDLTGTTIDINGTLDLDGGAHNIDSTSTTTIGGDTSVVLAAPFYAFNGEANDYVASVLHPIIYSSSGGGSGDFVGLGHFIFQTRTDAARDFIFRGGTSPANIVRIFGDGSEVDITATTLDFNGNLDADGTTLDIDGSTSLSLHGGSADITLSGTEVDLTATTIDINGTADFSGSVTINGELFGGLRLTAASAFILYDDTDAASDESLWGWGVNSNQFRLVTMADAAPTSIVATPINIQRSSTSITEIELNATAFDLNGNLDLDGTTHDLNGSTSVTLTGTANAVLALTTSGFNMDGVLDLDGTGSHNLNGTTSVVLVSSSASISAIASGNEVDLTGTTIDINGNIDADGTTLDINGSTSLTLTGTANATLVLNTSGLALTGQTVITHSSANPLQVSRSGSASNCSIQFTTTGGSMYAGIASAGVFAIDADNNISSAPIASFSTSEIDLTATTLDFNGAVDISGATIFGGLTRRSTAAGATAAGSAQGDAHAISAEITQYTTVASGSGAVLPSSIGTTFIIINDGVNALNVYPASGDAIDLLGTNIPLVLPVGASVMIVCISASLYRTLNATYA